LLPVLGFVDDVVDILENPARDLTDHAGIVDDEAGFHGNGLNAQSRAELCRQSPYELVSVVLRSAWDLRREKCGTASGSWRRLPHWHWPSAARRPPGTVPSSSG